MERVLISKEKKFVRAREEHILKCGTLCFKSSETSFCLLHRMGFQIIKDICSPDHVIVTVLTPTKNVQALSEL